MTTAHPDLSSTDVYESFLDTRRYFAEEYEARASEDRREAEERRAWAERRPEGMGRGILEALDLDREAVERHVAEVGVAYREHLESHQVQPPEQPPDFGLPPVPDPGSASAFPYATVTLAEDRQALAMDESAYFEATSNPDAWNVPGFTPRQPFFWAMAGHGTGMAPGGLMAAYHHTTRRSLSWYFLHVPFGDDDWSCSVTPWFHGEYRAWAEPDWPFTNPWACTYMTAGLCLLPFGVPQPRYQDAQYSCETLIDVCGYDVNEWKWGGWRPSLAPLTPLPQHRNKPHWIIFTATGVLGVCGESDALLNFARGATSSGSLEAGTYRETKFGIYCPTAKIQW